MLVEHLGQVLRHLLARPGGYAVDDDGEGRTALTGRAQVIPRHRIGVAGSRRDEQPQVGGAEQLGRQLVVGDLDGIDVGRVEDGETLVESG